MQSTEKVFDSPEEFVNTHIRDYVESNGQIGHIWRGYPTLLLTTRGRKSGLWRRTALIYGTDSHDFIVVASNGGSTSNPLWYLNLVEEPRVGLQVGADIFTAHAAEVSGDEKERLWRIMADIFPTYDQYRTTAAKRGRDIPLIVLKRQQNESGS